MILYWRVIHIWHVSTTCNGVDIWMQQYYINGKRKIWNFDTVFSNVQTIRVCHVLFFLYARRFRGYNKTLPLFCGKTFSRAIFFSVFDSLCSSMIVPHRNHKCQELTSWPIARINLNHKWKFMLVDQISWIHIRLLCQVTEYIRKFSLVFISSGSLVVASVVNGHFDEIKW